MRSLTPSIGRYEVNKQIGHMTVAHRYQPEAQASGRLALQAGALTNYAHLRAGLVEELRRADDAGDNQLVVNARVENASPGGVAAAVHDAVEELVVVLLDQVLMILGAGEDRGSDLGPRGAVGEGGVPGGAAAGVHSPAKGIIVEGIQPGAPCGACLSLIKFRRSDQVDSNLFHRAAGLQEVLPGRQAAGVGGPAQALLISRLPLHGA